MNIIMAFVIDVYSAFEENEKEEQEERAAIIDFGKQYMVNEDEQ